MDMYYNLLGLNRDSTKDDIKKAYKRQILKWHPDKHPDKELATNTFNLLTEAYKYLMDENNTTNNIDELIGRLFEKPKYNNEKTRDKIININISLNDLYNGKHIKINIKSIFTKCVKCRGIGTLYASICRHCDGNCKIYLQNGFRNCNECKGRGYIRDETRGYCSECGGRGGKDINRIFEFDIIRGTKIGERYVFPNAGPWEMGYKDAGNFVFIIANVLKHKTFERDGDNLIMYKNIGLKAALCGVDFIIEHLDGQKINIKYNKVVNFNDKIKIEGKGMPILCDLNNKDADIEYNGINDNININSNTNSNTNSNNKLKYGDLIIILNIIMPPALTDVEKNNLKDVLPSYIIDNNHVILREHCGADEIIECNASLTTYFNKINNETDNIEADYYNDNDNNNDNNNNNKLNDIFNLECNPS